MKISIVFLALSAAMISVAIAAPSKYAKLQYEVYNALQQYYDDQQAEQQYEYNDEAKLQKAYDYLASQQDEEAKEQLFGTILASLAAPLIAKAING